MREVSMMMRKQKGRSKQVESKGRKPHSYLDSILLMLHAESMTGVPEIWSEVCTAKDSCAKNSCAKDSWLRKIVTYL